MSNLEEFHDRLQAALRTVPQPPATESAPLLMVERERREAQFETIASRLLNEVIEPRLRTLGNLCEGARLVRRDPQRSCAIYLGYRERFPAATRLEIQVSADDEVRTLRVTRETHIAPAYLSYERFARWEGNLESIDFSQVETWIEDELVRFGVDLSRFSCETAAGEAMPAVDPVCGMRVTVELTSIRAEYLGHPYYFCSAACRDKFSERPLAYVTITPE